MNITECNSNSFGRVILNKVCMLLSFVLVVSCAGAGNDNANALEPIVKVYDDASAKVGQAKDVETLISIVKEVKDDVMATVADVKSKGVGSDSDKLKGVKKIEDANRAFQEKLDRKATELGATPAQREEILEILKEITYRI